MATCEKRIVRPEPPPVEYVLVLTTKEAEDLHFMLGNRVDWRENPVAKEIYTAMTGTGVRRDP